ncbi:MAG: hypothetical protein RSC25_04610 [Christensenella sp.]
MKRMIAIILMLLILVMGQAVGYAVDWKADATPEATATTSAAVRSMDANTPMHGYIGSASTAGVDVDNDGKTDISVSANDLISVSVPLDVVTRAEMYANAVRFYSPDFEILNNGAVPLRVSMVDFKPKVGNTLAITAWNAAHGANDIAIKMMQTTYDPVIWEKDITTIGSGYLFTDSLKSGDSVKFKLDATYAKDMLNAHMNTTQAFDCVYKIEAAE